MNNIFITTLPREQTPRMIPLLKMSEQKPYRFLLHETREELGSLWYSQIEATLTSGKGQNFVCFVDNNVAGVIAYADLPWESRIFNKKMGSISLFMVDPKSPLKKDIANRLLDRVIDWALSNGIEFLLCKTYTDDIFSIHCLESKGFLLMDTLLDYVYDYRRNPLKDVVRPIISESFNIRQAREDDEQELVEIARVSFHSHFGRFHADERIPRQLATQVYEEWVRSSIHGYADWIMVAESGGRIAGYSAWKKPSRLELSLNVPVGRYSICGICPDYQGNGLFSILTYEGMKLLSGMVTCIEGPTHINNYPVQRGYDKLNWKIADARHSFHKWLTPEANP